MLSLVGLAWLVGWALVLLSPRQDAVPNAKTRRSVENAITRGLWDQMEEVQPIVEELEIEMEDYNVFWAATGLFFLCVSYVFIRFSIVFLCFPRFSNVFLCVPMFAYVFVEGLL